MNMLCLSDPLTLLTGESPAGGTFSGPGVTGNSFDPSTGVGSYIINYFYTDANNCAGSASDTMFVDICTGISSNNTNNSIQILPNPNNGTFSIQLGTTNGDLQLTLRNALGQVVKTVAVPAGKNTVDMSGVSAGIYLLDVVGVNGKVTKKVIVR